MNIIKRLRWSLGHGNPVVPSRWRATAESQQKSRALATTTNAMSELQGRLVAERIGSDDRPNVISVDAAQTKDCAAATPRSPMRPRLVRWRVRLLKASSAPNVADLRCTSTSTGRTSVVLSCR